MDPIEFLKQHEPFSSLSPSGLEDLRRHLEIAYVKRGATILARRGPKNTSVWIVRKGSVRLEVDGRAIDELGEGEPFGYPSLIAGKSPEFDVIATDDCLLYRLQEATFRRLLQESQFGEFFLEGLAGRLRRATEREPVPLAGDLATPVSQLVRRDPVFVPSDRTVGEAAQLMRRERVSSVLVEGEPMGILTDHDLRARVLADGLGPATPVGKVMSTPLKTTPADSPLFEALLLLLDQRIHHLPLERDGKIVGLVTHTDLLRHQVKSPGYLLKRIDKANNLSDLEGYAGEIAGMVESLLLGGLEASDIGRIVASLNDAVVQRLIRHAQNEIGPPPCAFAWIVFGSEGRREQALITDQDNALVFAEDNERARDYFGTLAHEVVDGLIRASFPPCQGGYMATRWHRPLAEWDELFRTWTTTPEPQALMEAANFFDFRAIYGELDLEPLHQRILDGATHRLFLAHLTRAGLGMRPPLGLFNRIKEEKEGIDLKAGGLMPIVSLARIWGFEAGSRDRSTLGRLLAARRVGVLSDEGADTLSEGFRFLFRLRLHTQLQAVRRGEAADNRVHLNELSALERRHLKDTFLQIRQMQEAISDRYAVGMLG